MLYSTLVLCCYFDHSVKKKPKSICAVKWFAACCLFNLSEPSRLWSICFSEQMVWSELITLDEIRWATV